MRTSYFSKTGKHNDAVSIAGKAPPGFTGRQYKDLAPLYWFYAKYKEDGDEAFYTAKYREEILDKLDPQKVYEDLGEDAILLCWEGSGKFCHRRLVAAWLEEILGIEVAEL